MGLFGRRRRRRRALFYWLEGTFLLAGILLVGYTAWLYGSAHVDESWAKYQLEQQLKGMQPTFTGYLGSMLGMEGNPQDVAPPAEQQRSRASIAPGETIGRIEIPRLKISAIVRSGVDDKTLKRAVGHVPSTALPGETGNVGLAAHRDTHFRNLRGVKEGDAVRLVTPGGTFEYQVQSTSVVKPENVEVLDPTPEPALTLVTCYPFNFVGSAPKRFIVRALQIGSSDATAAAPAGEKAVAAPVSDTAAPETPQPKKKKRASSRRRA